MTAFKPTHVIYHENCSDGFGAAYAIWKHFGDSVKYIPLSYTSTIPEFCKEDRVLVVDFCFNLAECLKIYKIVDKFQILDHHKTAKEEIGDQEFAHFDMKKSGAMLAWEWCTSDGAPDVIKYVQDADLWKFELPYSKEYSAALRLRPLSFDIWNNMQTGDIIREGMAVVQNMNSKVDELCKSAIMMQIHIYTVPVVNTDMYISNVCHRLLELYPDTCFSAAYYDRDDVRQWSLRCRDNFDVSEIAKIYGGGGHQKAAGFTVKMR